MPAPTQRHNQRQRASAIVIWYAPDAKRTVKHVRTVLTTDGTRLAEDTYELVKYVVQ